MSQNLYSSYDNSLVLQDLNADFSQNSISEFIQQSYNYKDINLVNTHYDFFNQIVFNGID